MSSSQDKSDPAEACEFFARRGHVCDEIRNAPSLWCNVCLLRLSVERLTPQQIASYAPGEYCVGKHDDVDPHSNP
jgi:hypothetical protein